MASSSPIPLTPSSVRIASVSYTHLDVYKRQRHLPQDAPEKWETFRRYCVRDVDVETDIRHRLARYPRPQAELDAWTLDPVSYTHLMDGGSNW